VDLTYVKYRIIAFTDGEDNSGMHAFDVASLVLSNNIVVDAVIIGGSDSAHHPLRSLAHSTGGFTVRIPEDRSVLSAVFERESVLALSERKTIKPDVKPTILLNDFLLFGDLEKYPVVTVKGLTSTAASTVSAHTQSSSVASKAVSMSTSNSNNNAAPTSASTANVPGGAVKRISKELKDIQDLADDSLFEVFVTEDNILDWKVMIKGPKNTPYEGGLFMLHVVFPQQYPFQPPKVQFVTSIYHCNVSSEGRLCLNVLRDSWTPSLTFIKVMENIKLMLIEPDTLDALDAWKGSLARTEPEVYRKNAREHTLTTACGGTDTLKKQFNLI